MLPMFGALSVVGADVPAFRGQKDHVDSLSDDKLSPSTAIFCSEDEAVTRSLAGSEDSAVVMSGSTTRKPSSCNAQAQWMELRATLWYMESCFHSVPTW